MTLITLQDGKLVLRDGAIGTEQACCCAKCSGPCDDNEDCAPGCECVDGECVPKNCSIKSCTIVPVPDNFPQVMPAGDCEADNVPGDPECCCEGLPQGGCFVDEIIDENGNPPPGENDWIFKGTCNPCCDGSTIYFSAKRQVGDASPEAWVDNVRQYLEDNGYTNITQYSEPCDLGGGPDRIVDQLAWVRACCDQDLLCPDTAEDCSDIFSFQPEESGGLQPELFRLGDAPNTTVCPVVDGFLDCIPVCGENPLP
jgi:hypothetical protein